jgi:hypothetical protein
MPASINLSFQLPIGIGINNYYYVEFYSTCRELIFLIMLSSVCSIRQHWTKRRFSGFCIRSKNTVYMCFGP